MNAMLRDLLKKYNAEFCFNDELCTWCIFGVENGLAWETDDFDANSLECAEISAIDYLIEYNQ